MMNRILICGLALLWLSACDILSFFEPKQDSNPASLKAFESQAEFDEYVRREIGARSGRVSAPVLADEDTSAPPPTGDLAPTPTDGSAGLAEGQDESPGFSQTTIQEAGVDEADVVKTDGAYFYILIESGGDGSTLRIVQVAPREALAVVGEAAVEGFGRDLYLLDQENLLVAVTSTFGGYFAVTELSEPGPVGELIDAVAIAPLVDGQGSEDGGGGSDDSGAATDPGTGDDVGRTDEVDVLPVDGLIAPDLRFERPRTIVSVIDVSDPSQPRMLSVTRFDGTASSSRMIDGVLHLVIANYQEYYFDVLPLLGRAELNAGGIDGEMVLPKFEHIEADQTVSGDVLTWENLYYPESPDGFGVVSLVSVDVLNDASFEAVGVVAQPGLIYSSLQAMYLTNTSYDLSGDLRASTSIYKFAYRDRGADPVAAGSVPGRVLNQYSMGEFDGYLRVATTLDRTFGLFGTETESSNNVYVLDETDGGLEIVGRIENIAPGETIQSARFAGARGYLVTFRQIDPLFTLNLSAPTLPRIVGELKVPGFSTYLIPMDEGHLLAVGQYIPDDGTFFARGVQLTVFDVTDFANPVQLHNVILGSEGYAWSEALFDPKAFTYYPNENLVALPVTIEDIGGFAESPPVAVADPAEGASGSDDPVSSDTGDVPDSPPPDDTVVIDAPFVSTRFDGLMVYRVTAEGGIAELGRISTDYSDVGGWNWSSFTRGVFVDGDAFAVTDQGVRGSPVGNMADPSYELFFGPGNRFGSSDGDVISVSGGGSQAEPSFASGTD